MIRRAKLVEIPEILNITKACATDMASRGIFQWNEHYPSREAFETDVARDELFVLENSGRIIGSIVISGIKDPEYREVSWLTADAGNLYIHRLAVHPALQGKGYASKLMDFAEARGREQGVPSIRLDTFSRNHRNQKFYEARGYIRLEAIYFPKQSAYPFHCYELVL